MAEAGPIGRRTRRCRCWNKVSRPRGLTENESAAVRGPRAPPRARPAVDRACRREGSSKTAGAHQGEAGTLGEVPILGKLAALRRARWMWGRPQENKAFVDFEIYSRN